MKGNLLGYSNTAYFTTLLLLSIALWLPRLEGPIDLRYDAGVYYILGSSLAEGKGYRLLNEPGEIRAVQYPPLLPLIAAIHQWAAGTTDPAIAGHWLRISYCIIYLALVSVVFLLSRCYLSPLFAFLATLVVILNLDVNWSSELLHTEIPFTLITLLFFVLIKMEPAGFWRHLPRFLAIGSFFLRSSGITLLAAWATGSLLRGRIREFTIRSIVAVIPLLAWQLYVAQVKSGAEYTQPAYEYQRAAFQFNNVSYLENLTLVDPFIPMKGTLTLQILFERMGHNLIRLPKHLGEAVSSRAGSYNWLNEKFSNPSIPTSIVNIALSLLGLLILAGLLLLWARGEWLIPLYIMGSVLLLCIMPWPGQVHRYLIPLTPLLSLALFLVLGDLWKYLSAVTGYGWRYSGMILGVSIILGILAQEGVVLWKANRMRQHYQNRVLKESEHTKHKPSHLFFYTPAWQQHDMALDWLKKEANPKDIVATSTPHWAYLKTGLRAVLPPFEADVARGQRLVESVPIKYLVIDSKTPLIPSATSSQAAGRKPIDLTQRFAAPIVGAFPDCWQLIYSQPTSSTQIYRRVAGGKMNMCHLTEQQEN